MKPHSMEFREQTKTLQVIFIETSNFPLLYLMFYIAYLFCKYYLLLNFFRYQPAGSLQLFTCYFVDDLNIKKSVLCYVVAMFFSWCVFIQMTNLLVNYSLYVSSFINPLSNRLIQSCYLIKVLLHHSVIPHKFVQVPLLCSSIHDISHRTAGLLLQVYS